ncbi:hypothetical protein [Nannocystis exedens]|nr:hypothetical protein [Nannocystis exedens]
MQVPAQFASQEQVITAAGVPSPVVRKWVQRELMPEPRRAGGGHAQGTRNLWPPWAVERASWIREQLRGGASLEQLVVLVRHGLGVPSAPILEAEADGELSHAPSEESAVVDASPTIMNDPVAPEPLQITLESFNLLAAERRLCEVALQRAGSLVGAAKLLGITRHALKRRIIKLRLDGPGARQE